MSEQWSEAQRHAERARSFFQSGRWDHALRELRLAVDLRPQQSEWHLGMGLTLDALGRYEDAVECYERCLRLAPEDPATLQHLGRDLLRLQRWGAAIEAYARLAELDPACEAAYCQRILAYARLGDHEQAELMFYIAQEIDDHCPHCHDHLAHSLLARGRADRAAWCWERAMEIDPTATDAALSLGQLCLRKGDHPRACALFRMHLRRSAGDVPTLLALGVCLIEMDRLGEAGEKFRRAIEQDPRCAQAHFHLGELALLADHLDAAERRLEQARQLDDAMPGVYLRLAQVAHQRHREEAARARLFEEVRRFLAEPGATGILAAQPLRCGPQGRALDLAHMLLAIGEPFTVGEVLDRLDSLGLAPRPEERALACNYRSRACLMTGQARAAARWARLSRDAKRDNPLAAYHLAMAYHRLHRPRAALAAIRRALHADPQDADLQRSARQINRALWWNRLRRWLHLPRLSPRRSPEPDSGPD